MVLPTSVYEEKKIHCAYAVALAATFAGAVAFLVAFMWRDIIIGVLKKYGYYDVDNGFENKNGIAWAVGIAFFLTFLAAALTVLVVKFEKCL